MEENNDGNVRIWVYIAIHWAVQLRVILLIVLSISLLVLESVSSESHEI